ncbi:hypothetical protein HispidOSU_008100, partial [Sigmodon hispidus]
LRTLGTASNTTLGRSTDMSFRDANLCNGSELIDRQQDNKLGNVNEPGMERKLQGLWDRGIEGFYLASDFDSSPFEKDSGSAGRIPQ